MDKTIPFKPFLKWILVAIVVIMGFIRIISDIQEIAKPHYKMSPSNNENNSLHGHIFGILLPSLFTYGGLVLILALNLPGLAYQKLVSNNDNGHTEATTKPKTTFIASATLLMIICSLVATLLTCGGISLGLGPIESTNGYIQLLLNAILGAILAVLACTVGQQWSSVAIVSAILILQLAFQFSQWCLGVGILGSTLSSVTDGKLLVEPIYEAATREGLAIHSIRFWSMKEIDTAAMMAYIASPFMELLLIDPMLLTKLGAAELEAVAVHELGHRSHHDGYWRELLRTIPSLVMAIGTMLALCFPQTWLGPLNLLGGNDKVLPAMLGAITLTGVVSTVLYPFYLWWLRSREYQADEFAVQKGHGSGLISYLELQSNESIGGNATWAFETFIMTHPIPIKRINHINDLLSRSRQ